MQENDLLNSVRGNSIIMFCARIIHAAWNTRMFNVPSSNENFIDSLIETSYAPPVSMTLQGPSNASDLLEFIDKEKINHFHEYVDLCMKLEPPADRRDLGSFVSVLRQAEDLARKKTSDLWFLQAALFVGKDLYETIPSSISGNRFKCTKQKSVRMLIEETIQTRKQSNEPISYSFFVNTFSVSDQPKFVHIASCNVEFPKKQVYTSREDPVDDLNEMLSGTTLHESDTELWTSAMNSMARKMKADPMKMGNLFQAAVDYVLDREGVQCYSKSHPKAPNTGDDVADELLLILAKNTITFLRDNHYYIACVGFPLACKPKDENDPVLFGLCDFIAIDGAGRSVVIELKTSAYTRRFSPENSPSAAAAIQSIAYAAMMGARERNDNSRPASPAAHACVLDVRFDGSITLHAIEVNRRVLTEVLPKSSEPLFGKYPSVLTALKDAGDGMPYDVPRYVPDKHRPSLETDINKLLHNHYSKKVGTRLPSRSFVPMIHEVVKVVQDVRSSSCKRFVYTVPDMFFWAVELPDDVMLLVLDWCAANIGLWIAEPLRAGEKLSLAQARVLWSPTSTSVADHIITVAAALLTSTKKEIK